MRFRCLVIALALLAAFASDSWGQSKQPPKIQAQPAQQQTAPDQRGTENSPVVVKVLPAQEDEKKAKDDAREHDEKRKFDADTLWLSKITVALILLQVLIFVAQAYFLWGTLNATAVAADAAKSAAILTERSLMEADRPIIDIRETDLDFLGERHDGKPTIAFTLANIGNKPAFVEASFVQISFRDVPESPMADEIEGGEVHPIIIGERSVMAGYELSFIYSRRTKLTEEQKKRFLDKTMQVYFHGCLTYRSPLGARWKKGFVKWWVPPMGGIVSYVESVIDPGRNFDRRIDNQPQA